MKFYEVQKYLSLTRHMYNPAIVLYSKQLFDKLSTAEQTALRDCTFTERLAQRQLNRQQGEEGLGRLKAKGMVVNAISPVELARMREAVKPVYEKALPAIGADMMAAVSGDIKAVAGK